MVSFHAFDLLVIDSSPKQPNRQKKKEKKHLLGESEAPFRCVVNVDGSKTWSENMVTL
jgi:hypothetical protein